MVDALGQPVALVTTALLHGWLARPSYAQRTTPRCGTAPINAARTQPAGFDAPTGARAGTGARLAPTLRGSRRVSFVLDNRAEILRLTLEHLLLSGVVARASRWWSRCRSGSGSTGAHGGSAWSPPWRACSTPCPASRCSRSSCRCSASASLPTVLGLVLYAQLMLVRAVVNGLDSVPEDVRDAAIGMGIDRWTILTQVDLPLALPVFLAGVRVAAVTVIGIATIGAVIDAGGLGELILQGIQRGADRARRRGGARRHGARDGG